MLWPFMPCFSCRQHLLDGRTSFSLQARCRSQPRFCSGPPCETELRCYLCSLEPFEASIAFNSYGKLVTLHRAPAGAVDGEPVCLERDNVHETALARGYSTAEVGHSAVVALTPHRAARRTEMQAAPKAWKQSAAPQRRADCWLWLECCSDRWSCTSKSALRRL